MQKFGFWLVLFALMQAFTPYANADVPATLQNSVERFDPGKTSSDISDEQNFTPPVAPANVVNIKGKPAPVADEATVNIKFRLKKIVLLGNTSFTSEQLSKLYQDKLNTDVSLADLEQIAQKITEYYRNAGYVLTQTIIPPQEINQEGVVTIKIIEGYINKVSVTGCKSDNVCALLTAYGKHIAQDAPLRLETLERFSFLANDIPGATVRAVLTKSTQFTGAADLTFIVEEKNYGGYVAYNNYNTQVLGRQQFIGNVYVDNIFSASETAINGIISKNTDRMRYASFSHRQQLNSNGLGARFSISNIKTQPNMQTIGLDGLIIPGTAFTMTGGADYAWIRSHSQNFYVGMGFKFLNSSTTYADTTLFKDNIRSINCFLSYNFLQSSSTYNSLMLTLSQGLRLFDAQGNPPSRVGENITFTKIDLYASSSHRFTNTSFNSMLAIKAQYAFNTVPSSETFAYGGVPFGSGYDPAEFTGDRGIAGLAELHYPAYSIPRWKLTSQIFGFVDFGFVWNINTSVPPTTEAGASIGAGHRIVMSRHVNLDFIVAQPLKPPTIEGNANYTRVLFNIRLTV